MEDARSQLARSLGAHPTLDRLTDAEAAQVASLLAAAERTEREALNASIDTALRHLPRLVRVPARKILFG